MKKKEKNEVKNVSLLERFIKGIIVGMSNLVPGISAGTITITIGLYEGIINAVNTLRHNFKKSMQYLLPIGIGMIIGLLAFSNVVSYGLNSYPFATKMLFIGLIFGGLPMLYKEVKGNTRDTKNIAAFIIGLVAVVAFALLQTGASEVSFASLDLIGVLKLVIVGCLAAFTMVIPGISGSLLLLLLGYFNPVINLLKDLSRLGNVGQDLIVLIPFGIGVLIGIILAVKVINYLLTNYKVTTYSAILGFVVGSVITIFIGMSYTIGIGEILLGLGLCLFGILGALKLGEK